MVKEKYLKKVRQIIDHDGANGKYRAFLFGSSLVKERFGDLDIGVIGKISKLGETFVSVEVASGVELQVQRAAIVQVLPKGTYK